MGTGWERRRPRAQGEGPGLDILYLRPRSKIGGHEEAQQERETEKAHNCCYYYRLLEGTPKCQRPFESLHLREDEKMMP